MSSKRPAAATADATAAKRSKCDDEPIIETPQHVLRLTIVGKEKACSYYVTELHFPRGLTVANWNTLGDAEFAAIVCNAQDKTQWVAIHDQGVVLPPVACTYLGERSVRALIDVVYMQKIHEEGSSEAIVVPVSELPEGGLAKLLEHARNPPWMPVGDDQKEEEATDAERYVSAVEARARHTVACTKGDAYIAQSNECVVACVAVYCWI